MRSGDFSWVQEKTRDGSTEELNHRALLPQHPSVCLSENYALAAVFILRVSTALLLFKVTSVVRGGAHARSIPDDV